ncbi:GntR family transcriptional regulator [Actinomadura viridis]|uniref:DNA-binding GntR family transcriptional regulator n=1 Tax=Actinomadura viridis TaxID=58110 RepID=A0A931DPU7_9ACTN|nr:GntR family transcriptional regulator [Actinomadura viridis]MBG6090533.1 DNA-binding GntR family transcriptional regulator [Actinomadura viridis]
MAPEPPASLLAAQAYARLRADILNNRLMPGTPLSVPALATRLDMSRSPVREAVQRLIHDGLATQVAHRGAAVARIDPAELDDLYVVKEPLEGLATRLATPRLTLDGERRLRRMVEEHERLLESGAPESAHVQMDLDLHRYIREVAGNAALIATLEQFEGKTNLAFPTLWSDPEASRLAVEEHRAIIEAMIAGDPGGAERAARNHVERIRLRWARRMVTTLESAAGA